MTPQHETSNNLGTNNHTNDTAIPTPTIQLGTAAPQESQIANNESLDSKAKRAMGKSRPLGRSCTSRKGN
jgi:hypothetical protein